MSTPSPADTSPNLQTAPLDFLASVRTVAGALAEARSLEFIARTIVAQAPAVFGAPAGTLCLLDDDGVTMRMVETAGHSKEHATQWREISITAPTPAAAAARERRAIAYGDREEYLRDYPEIRSFENVPSGARAAAPLLLGDRVIGGIGLDYADARAFSDTEIQLLETMALLCAQAIERARLQESEQEARHEAAQQRDRLASLFEHLHLTSQAVGFGTWEWDARTNVVYWSEAYRDVYGIDREASPTFENGIAAVLEEDRPGVVGSLERCVNGDEDFITEHRILHPSGGPRWIRGIGRFLRGTDGERTRLVGVVWDVTSQRQAIEALRTSEERYRALASTSSAIVWTADATGEFVTEQPAWTAYTGQSFEECRGWGRLNALHPDDRDAVCAAWDDAVSEGRAYESEERIWHAQSKEYRWHRARSVPVLESNGSIREWVGLLEDIHERKLRHLALATLNQLEEQIRAQSDPDRILMEAVTLLGETLALGHCHFAEVDWERDLTFTRQGYARDTVSVDGLEAPASAFGPDEFMHALRAGRAVVVDDARIHPFTAERYEQAFAPLNVGAFVMVPCMRGGECVAVMVADSQRDRKWDREEIALLETAAARTWLAVENARLFREAQRELEERRRAEATLLESEERLRLAIEGADLGTTHWNLVTNEVSWSDTMARIFGRTPDQIRKVEDVTACIHPDDRQAQAERVRAVRSGRADPGLEYRVVWPDGSIRWVQSKGRVYLDEQGRAVRFEGIVQDITVRKEAETAIEQSRNDLQLITDAAPLLISYVDRNQVFRFNNKHYERWFGGSLPQIVGRHIRDVLGAAAYDGVKEHVEQALRGEAVSFETYMPYSTAVPRYIRGDFVPDIGEDGRIRGFVAVVTDITAAKLSALEREHHLEEIAALNDNLQRAMTETHHRVKNNLQGIGALVEVQANDYDGSLAPDAVRRLITQIQTLAKVHDILTHQARTDATADTIASRAIVEQLVSSLRATADGRSLTADVENFPLPIRQGTSLAIILNEVVTNSLKHGGQAVAIRLSRRAGLPSEAVLEVRDDGPGFPPEFSAERSGHIGLELVGRLCRWDLRGSVTYGARDGGGACVTIAFPIDPRQDAAAR